MVINAFYLTNDEPTFPASILVQWDESFEHGSRGECEIEMNWFLKTDKAWIRKYNKKILSLVPYSKQKEIVKTILEYLEYNSKRLEAEIKEYKAFHSPKYSDANERIIENQKELERLKHQREAARKQKPNGRFYYDETAPAKGAEKAVREKISAEKEYIRRVMSDYKQLKRDMERCQANEAAVREILEVMQS